MNSDNEVHAIAISYVISFYVWLSRGAEMAQWHSPPTNWPGFDSQTRRHMCVELFGSLLCTKRFSPGTSVFPSPQKPTFDLT